MQKDIETIREEIKEKQEKEYHYKGKLNHDLYIVGYATNEDRISMIHWRNRNVSMLNDFINNAKDNKNIQRVAITNRYDDWFIDILTK